MAILALALYLAAVILSLGVRSVVQWRRTGDSGLRLDAGRRFAASWWAKVAFLLALVLGPVAPIAALAGLAPVTRHPALPVSGIVVAVAGAVVLLVAQAGMGSSWRIGVDQREHTGLVTGGLFGIVRNPIFTAMCAVSGGLALMVPNVVSFAATGVLIAAIQAQVRVVEEPYLLRTHGAGYLAYAGRVGRFLPSIGTLRPPTIHRGH
jgi:protein-S-isoprenylcysteine O-methyltransferase Ste14